MATPKSVEEYVNSFPAETQTVLHEIIKLIREVAPEAQEMISYQMPTFELNGNRIYFAANKQHIGFYAIYQPTDFEEELVEYRSTKDTIRIPLDEPLPQDLIRKLIRYKLLS